MSAYTEKEYGAIVYGRAPLFFKALRDRMGGDAFDRFLGEYCVRFRWEMADCSDFLALAARTCVRTSGCSLDELASEWGARVSR